MKVLLAIVLLLGMVNAQAQDDYPSRPVNIIVPFPPGGVADLNARAAAEVLTRLLKQPFVLVSRPGAGGATGNAQVANAKPDGYTLLAGLASMVVIPPAERLGGKEPSYQLEQCLPTWVI